MGWDAYATKNGETIEWRRNANNRLEIADDTLRAAFAEASNREGAADGNLPIGSLDCSGCAEALEKATGLNAYDEDGWTPEAVKDAACGAVWAECDPRYRESARAFLETCAAHNLGVRFSW